MGITLVVYDTGDEAPRLTGQRYADDQGILGIGIGSNEELKTALATLLSKGTRIDQLRFYTHGQPGALTIGKGIFMAHDVQAFAGNGFENLFAPNAVIFFDGCQVARGDYGLRFLKIVAKTFLFKGGGCVGGFDTDGYAFPWGKKIYHDEGWFYNLVGLGASDPAYFAYIWAGGSRTRVTGGRLIPPSELPWKWWKVLTLDQITYYYFGPSKVGLYLPPDDNRAIVYGRWRVVEDRMEIEWSTGQHEQWDYPLFATLQTGIAWRSKHIIGSDLLAMYMADWSLHVPVDNDVIQSLG